MSKLSQSDIEYLLLDAPVLIGQNYGFTKLKELHNDWIKDMILGTEDETLQSHRGSYKTTCVSIALACICVVFPYEKTMFSRKTDDDVKEIIAQTKKILLSDTMQSIVYSMHGQPLQLTVDNANEISTTLCANDPRGTSQLVAMGSGSSLTGKHFDRIFTDDIVNIKDRISKAERDKTKLFYQELQNIKNRTGRIYNTGTPWHKDDCFSIMPKPKIYDCYSTGLISSDELESIRSNMVPSLFAANYELKHIASDDVIFTAPKTGADASLAEQGNTHIDAAYGGSDWTAMTICNKRDGKYYILGKCWHKSIDDVIDETIAIHRRFNSGKWYMENNGDKGYLAKEYKKRGERVVSYHEQMNKFVKITSYLKAEWKNIVFVEGTDEEYIDMICDYNENAEHDDCPDSCASMIRQLWNKKDRTEDDYTSIYL